MLETSARLLRLLSLLQTRRDWTSTELATRLGVTTRTIRNDVERLRGLGYPVDARPGVAGGYRLGAGGGKRRDCEEEGGEKRGDQLMRHADSLKK